MRNMSIATRESIDAKVLFFLEEILKSTAWEDDNYICVCPTGAVEDEDEDGDKVVHYTEVGLYTYSGDYFVSSEVVIYFHYVDEEHEQLEFCKDYMDSSSVVDIEDAHIILVNKIQSMFDRLPITSTP